jgi:rhodanese-related sulfurtransferase
MVQDISSSEAWAALEADPQAQLIDVRTVAEWNFVGIPDLSELERQTILIEYQSFQSPMPNDQFVPSLARADLNPKQTLLFICRTGGRSRAAAHLAEAAGYAKCFNVADGFEGALDENNHRGHRNGWKAANLPWRQG